MNRPVVVAVAVAIALLLATVAGSRYLRVQPHQLLPVLDGGDFILPGIENRDFHLAEFRGKIVLLNLGFTSFSDVCHTVLSRLGILPNFTGVDFANNQPLFVTTDPERDSGNILTALLPCFHDSITGLSGYKQQLKVNASLYKLTVRRNR